MSLLEIETAMKHAKKAYSFGKEAIKRYHKIGHQQWVLNRLYRVYIVQSAKDGRASVTITPAGKGNDRRYEQRGESICGTYTRYSGDTIFEDVVEAYCDWQGLSEEWRKATISLVNLCETPNHLKA